MIPVELLERCRGARVLLLLVGNCEVEGTMTECDVSCNILLSDAASYRTLPAAKVGDKDSRERTGEFSLLLVPSHSIEFVVPGGAQGSIVSTIATTSLTA